MQIIPAIDIIGGKCVRLSKGDYARVTEYSANPLEVARTFEEAGIRRLHVVDLDGARASHVVNLGVLRSICSGTDLQVDFGGGIKTREDLSLAFEAGAAQVTAGSIAAKDPELVKSWIQEFGAEKIILGADVLKGKIMVSGWQQSSEIDLFEFLEGFLIAGARYVICTDISRDGMLSGPAFDLYREIINRFPSLKLIASGGVSAVQDLERLSELNLYGAIVGKAFYEGKVSLQELTRLQNAD